MAHPWHYYTMAALYIGAGAMHFVKPRMYGRIMPGWIPAHMPLVYLSGILEMVFGAALFFPAGQQAGLYGIIALLVLFLPVHVHMLTDKKASMGLPYWVLLLRMPLQGLLIYWAYSYL